MDPRARSAGAPVRTKALRVFFAIWPDDSARERIAAIATNVARDCAGRAVPASNLHVTIAFIGSVVPDRLALLREAGSEATLGVDAFELAFERFGGAHKGELAWIAVRETPRPLRVLHANLDAALSARGFAVEQREFRPHLTIVRRCARRLARADPIEIVSPITSLTLMSSSTQAGGSEYRELAQWPLGAATPG
jgi:2'-5' RNA ligase